MVAVAKILFSISFRPLFILCAVIAVFNPIMWSMAYFGDLNIVIMNGTKMFWHGHEMLFGFTGALIGGFILTASAHWTNGVPYKGLAIILLTLIWLLGRVSFFLPIPISLHLILSSSFFPALAIMLLYKLWDFKKQKYMFCSILIGLSISNILYSYGHLYSNNSLEVIGRDTGVALIRFIIILIAGRVLPFFTSKKLPKLKIKVPNLLNITCVLSTASLVFIVPFNAPVWIASSLLIVCAMFNFVRLLYWKPMKVLKIPMLWILHIGIIFIVLSMVMESLSLYFPYLKFSKAPLHLFLIGGLGVIGIGFMSRVSLGHTGRVVKANKRIIISFIFIIISTILRTFFPVLLPSDYVQWIYLSAGCFSIGFILFLMNFLKILMLPKENT